MGRRIIDHSVYIGVAFTNPCGGADPAAAARGYLGACGVFAAITFVCVTVTCPAVHVCC